MIAKIARRIGWALAGAAIAYLIAVWLSGYFYSPFAPNGSDWSEGLATRYAMLCGAIFGWFNAWFSGD